MTTAGIVCGGSLSTTSRWHQTYLSLFPVLRAEQEWDEVSVAELGRFCEALGLAQPQKMVSHETQLRCTGARYSPRYDPVARTPSRPRRSHRRLRSTAVVQEACSLEHVAGRHAARPWCSPRGARRSCRSAHAAHCPDDREHWLRDGLAGSRLRCSRYRPSGAAGSRIGNSTARSPFTQRQLGQVSQATLPPSSRGAQRLTLQLQPIGGPRGPTGGSALPRPDQLD